MNKCLEVQNLEYFLDDRHLAQLFAPHGAVMSAKVFTDAASGQSTGFGLVEMASDDAGELAIAALNGCKREGNTLVVSWSGAGSDEKAATPQMFKSMNMTEEAVAPSTEPERRGLP
jgi:RNA recognition motif-containing protein